MPFALVLIGLIMVITGAKDTHEELGKQLTEDFTGEQNFTKWAAAIAGIGAVGYVKDLQPVSRVFLALLFVVMILSNGGMFNKFMDALNKGPESIPRPQSGGPATGPAALPENVNDPLSWLRWIEDRTKIPTMQGMPGADWIGAQSANVRANFQTFMDNIVPLVGKLVGIPGR